MPGPVFLCGVSLSYIPEYSQILGLLAGSYSAHGQEFLKSNQPI
jgi:hypothetical protein